MLVRLKQDWFGPNAHLYLKSPTSKGTTFVPDEYRDVLPPRSEIIDGDEVEVVLSRDITKPTAALPSLRDFDEARQAQEAEEAVRAKAEVFRQAALAGTKKPRSN